MDAEHSWAVCRCAPALRLTGRRSTRCPYCRRHCLCGGCCPRAMTQKDSSLEYSKPVFVVFPASCVALHNLGNVTQMKRELCQQIRNTVSDTIRKNKNNEW